MPRQRGIDLLGLAEGKEWRSRGLLERGQ